MNRITDEVAGDLSEHDRARIDAAWEVHKAAGKPYLMSAKSELRLRAAINHVLQRCNDNGGEIDAELVAELKSAVNQQSQ